MFNVGDEFRLQAKQTRQPDWYVYYRILEVRPGMGYWALPYAGSPAVVNSERGRISPFLNVPRLLRVDITEAWDITPVVVEPYWEVVACHE